MPAIYELPLFRIIQEALNNISQHARASSVLVCFVNKADGGIVISARDNGRGFDQARLGTADHTGHFGLRQMRERVLDLGGTLDICSAIDQGTEIVITLPLVANVRRARRKIENESNNMLKRNCRHLEHNFGHGQQHLSSVLFSLDLLAFLIHTAQHLVNEPYRLLCTTLSVRLTFFNDLRALTRYMLFDSWDALFRFMLEGLEVAILPDLVFSD